MPKKIKGNNMTELVQSIAICRACVFCWFCWLHIVIFYWNDNAYFTTDDYKTEKENK